jgi:hypothetical protein
MKWIATQTQNYFRISGIHFRKGDRWEMNYDANTNIVHGIRCGSSKPDNHMDISFSAYAYEGNFSPSLVTLIRKEKLKVLNSKSIVDQ